MKLHNIHTISVEDAQTMLMTQDYELMIKSGNIFFMKKTRLKIAYSNFIQELNELFSVEDISEKIDKAQRAMKFRLKIQKLEMMNECFKNVYLFKDEILNKKGELVSNAEKIQMLDKLKKEYRECFGRYPDLVDMEADTETYNKQVDEVLKPIKNEIRRLGIKLKMLTPKKEDVQKEENNNGLMWAVHFVEAVNKKEGEYDMSRKVYMLKEDLDIATEKYNNIKANGDS